MDYRPLISGIVRSTAEISTSEHETVHPTYKDIRQLSFSVDVHGSSKTSSSIRPLVMFSPLTILLNP